MTRFQCQVLSADTGERFEAAVRRAAELLRQGQLVALPTETVYGLAANALNEDAVARIFEAKGRPAHNPLIVHVSDIAMAKRCASAWPEVADRLAHAFWPGPLTMVFPPGPSIPNIVTARGATVGLRYPSHPLIQAVIRACGFPLAAPSANLSNRVSPTTAAHVRAQLGDRVPLIVDGGPCQVGIESTVVDLATSPISLLRPGIIHEEALLSVTGELALGHTRSGDVLRSPGQLRQHYAPRAPLLMWSWHDDHELLERISRAGFDPGHTFVLAHSQIPSGEAGIRVTVIPHDPEAFARAIYAELHRCDEADARLIVVEALPEGVAWKAIADRLQRAAAGNGTAAGPD